MGLKRTLRRHMRGSQRSASLLSGPPWTREPYRERVCAVGGLQLGVAVAARAKGHACETTESFVPATRDALQLDSLDQKQIMSMEEGDTSFPLSHTACEAGSTVDRSYIPIPSLMPQACSSVNTNWTAERRAGTEQVAAASCEGSAQHARHDGTGTGLHSRPRAQENTFLSSRPSGRKYKRAGESAADPETESSSPYVRIGALPSVQAASPASNQTTLEARKPKQASGHHVCRPVLCELRHLELGSLPLRTEGGETGPRVHYKTRGLGCGSIQKVVLTPHLVRPKTQSRVGLVHPLDSESFRRPQNTGVTVCIKAVLEDPAQRAVEKGIHQLLSTVYIVMTEALSGLTPKDHPGKENASATSFLILSHERKCGRLGAELCDLKDRRFKGTERARADQ
ncbi:hypothetical protein MG293_008015 [Ovis ammon polii]|uniref:Uncharacterized protein n=1 Tax=Ovis ammon polii TaxID=230172 RepID=A0AAD4U5L4_OVIAM|nr:hypothetical protein MG293_008015 [Ovis ammon polii]